MAPFQELRIVSAPLQADHALPASSDEELMLLTRAGSPASFAILAERYLGRVVNYCSKFTTDPVAAEDLAQEVFLRLWAHRRGYQARGPFRVFLFTIARNRCRNHARWWRRLLPRLSGDERAAERVAAPEASQLEAMLALERQRQAHDALRHIPLKQREALLLRFEQELDYAEMAQVLDCPEATARTRVFHGMRRLRELLGKERA